MSELFKIPEAPLAASSTSESETSESETSESEISEIELINYDKHLELIEHYEDTLRELRATIHEQNLMIARLKGRINVHNKFIQNINNYKDTIMEAHRTVNKQEVTIAELNGDLESIRNWSELLIDAKLIYENRTKQ